MRWESLFADLQVQWEAEVAAGLEAEIAEAERLERSGMHLAERLRAHQGAELTVQLCGGHRVQLRLGAVGEDWFSGQEGSSSVLIPTASVTAVETLGRGALHQDSPTRRRLSIAAPLRALVRDRAVVSVLGREGSVVADGLLVAAGRDHLDVALRVPGEIPRRSNQRGVRSVPFAAVAMVRADPGLSGG